METKELMAQNVQDPAQAGEVLLQPPKRPKKKRSNKKIVLLTLAGIAVLALALQVHAYANTDPAKRPHAFINPQRAMITLVLDKALGLAGAALAGWYGGQALMCLTHLEASYYHDAAVECAIALVICIIDMVIGIVSEGLCQLPPDEGAENPKLKRAERRRRLQQAAAKTAK